VRVKKIGRVCIDSALMERKLGSILWRRGAKISVSQPEVVIKVYIFKKAYTGYLIHSTDKKQFLLRQPNLKPFFRPGVIIPKLARALVNISGVRVNEILLDPMCGAGTILIEAGLMNIRFAGVEIFTNIVEGCAKNLSHFNLPVNLVKGDVKRLPFKDESFHAIVTDFPYLHSSKSYGRLDELYSRSLEEFQRVLKKGRRAVVISNLDVDEVILNHLEIEEKFYQRIHGSLTRRIFVCRKER
jgi:tRNA (guanine10-N2)-dimethyltransferase